MRVAGHYLHPSLQIDDAGIAVRYGKEMIFIDWQDIRSFALVNSLTFSKIPGKKTAQREAYEISDGTNRICWLADSPMPSYDLLWVGEVVLSAQDYTSFTQLLAALIRDKDWSSPPRFSPPPAETQEKQPITGALSIICPEGACLNVV